MTFVKINDLEFNAVIQTRLNDNAWDGRESKAITFTSTYEEAKNLFVNDAIWSVKISQNTINGNSTITETDMSEYAIAGPITDNRDGTITVKMGRYTDEELLEIPVLAAPKTRKEAVALRSAIENAA